MRPGKYKQKRLLVVIAPNSFKGTVSALEAARAIARGWHRVRSADLVELLPISDGGDGFGQALGAVLGAEERHARTVDAAHRPCTVTWWWDAKTGTAIIDSASVIGLARLGPGNFHPFDLDTLGLGTVVLAASRSGARRIVIGLGGSATNDAGFGFARAIGWQFQDNQGGNILRWTELTRLARIVGGPRARLGQVIAAVDVKNPLLGRRGATRTYGPQKGLREPEFGYAENCLRRLAYVVRRYIKGIEPNAPGTGAAGGLGFGLVAFAHAQLVSGFELFARHAKLWERIRRADLVLTGEGAIDRTTLMGKGVGEIARFCHRAGIKCFGLAGTVTGGYSVTRWFGEIRTLDSLTTVASAKSAPVFWLERLGADVAANLSLAGP